MAKEFCFKRSCCSPVLFYGDDNRINLEARKLLLEHGGYSVLTASNETEFSQLLNRHAVDLVILDYQRQDTTGAELAAISKQCKPHVPVLILSGSLESPPDCAHADAFISKVGSPTAVLQMVQQLLPRPASRVSQLS